MTYKKLYEQQIEENNMLRLRILNLKELVNEQESSLAEEHRKVNELMDEKESLMRDIYELKCEISDLEFDINWTLEHYKPL